MPAGAFLLTWKMVPLYLTHCPTAARRAACLVNLPPDIANRLWYPESGTSEARSEVRKTMTITINLAPETEEKLRQRAAESGLDPAVYARDLIERGLNGGSSTDQLSLASSEGMTFDEILAPFRKEVEQSGMTDDQLRDFFTEVRDEVRAEKRRKRAQGPAPE
jgi:predicted DNA-binding protein